jgi:acetolactate synthase small subunit
MRQTIRVWVEDKHGALLRVAGIITAKGANIHALTLTPDPWQESVSIITIISDLEPRLHRRVVNEMNRLINVFLAVDVTGNPRDALRNAPIREALPAYIATVQLSPMPPVAMPALSQEQAW